MKKFIAASILGYKALTTERVCNAENADGNNTTANKRSAICILFPDNSSNVTGLVSFHQESFKDQVNIVANVRGLKPNSLHGIHIHQYGDLTQGCITAGPHFNPFNKVHGGPHDAERHVGDLGNLKTDESGSSYMTLVDSLITLYGDHSIIGRSVVVHANEDDLGRGENDESKRTGNAGARVACGVIGITDRFKSLPPP